MMTTEKALELLKDHEYWTTYSWQDEVCEMAIKALEKQIPKKPYDVDTECKTFDCPECLSKLYANEDVRNCGYCCVCGQKLLWEEDEC